MHPRRAQPCLARRRASSSRKRRFSASAWRWAASASCRAASAWRWASSASRRTASASAWVRRRIGSGWIVQAQSVVFDAQVQAQDLAGQPSVEHRDIFAAL